MSGLLFVPQPLLDDWLQDGKVDVTSAGLRPLPEGELLAIQAAYRFVEVLDGEDQAGLLSKVKTEEQLRELGAEPYGDSVLLGEVVYQVTPGFLARTPAASQSALQQGERGLRNDAPDPDREGAMRIAEFFSE